MHRRRRILVLDAEAHRYDQTLSDISGMDIEAHGNEAARLIKAVRDWLNVGRDGGDPLPGSGAIIDDYAAFQPFVPDIIARLRLDDFDALPGDRPAHPRRTRWLRSKAALDSHTENENKRRTLISPSR